ncbi:P74 [Adoxophyes orana nucleopolyhedrovirus]|uniref:P74 n=1 Tax=Adoxophyes orana nucleopolyhedrovirus TaxID=542343 RepID=UPI0001829BEB|nr:P74 [Adoxophyes orana nucleopolyhedrovirus]ACF05318.1 P74 [Adoxophyes orana nucleopolyhedrovirus]
MATLTTEDLTNASKYAVHMHRLSYISRWRRRFPNIFIDYEIRPANNSDYYVPPKLVERAIAVSLKFSRSGCENMSCYPFHETGPINYATPFGYTQTSEVSVAYAQPACYNLDRSLATRENSEEVVQAPELRYTQNEQCILVDTFSKMYMNSPYLRTDDHLIKGVDDVPAFNVVPSDDPLFPEMFKGTFNEAYCRRFGRSLQNGGCSLQWWESLIGFVLGDTILITFKLMTNNIFSELRNFDYKHPSTLLPTKPIVDSENVLKIWQERRDLHSDIDREIDMANFKTLADLGISATTKLCYRAEAGYDVKQITATNNSYRRGREPAYLSGGGGASGDLDDARLDEIIAQFLEDHALIFGIATSVGFDILFEQLKGMLKKINSAMIPMLKRLLLDTSRQVTTRLLGETYKAAIVHQFNRIAIKTISAMAKAMTRIAIKAASVVGILLIIFSIADIVLMLWDPFGYSNMFPREFPDDLSRSFLSAYFESMGESRDLIEFLPEFFDDLVEEDDTAMFDSLLHILDYVSALEVNSNGQLLHLNTGPVIDDFDEMTLVGRALASSSMYNRIEFLLYTQKHNDILFKTANNRGNLAFVWFLGCVLLFFLNSRYENVMSLFVVFLLIGLYLFYEDCINYFINMQKMTDIIPETPWYQNLYFF